MLDMYVVVERGSVYPHVPSKLLLGGFVAPFVQCKPTTDAYGPPATVFFRHLQAPQSLWVGAKAKETCWSTSSLRSVWFRTSKRWISLFWKSCFPAANFKCIGFWGTIGVRRCHSEDYKSEAGAHLSCGELCMCILTPPLRWPLVCYLTSLNLSIFFYSKGPIAGQACQDVVQV